MQHQEHAAPAVGADPLSPGGPPLMACWSLAPAGPPLWVGELLALNEAFVLLPFLPCVLPFHGLGFVRAASARRCMNLCGETGVAGSPPQSERCLPIPA